MSILLVLATLQWLSLSTDNPLCRCFPEQLMIQHGRWRLLNSSGSSVVVFLAGWSQNTGVVARALLMDQQLGKRMLLSHLWELPWLSDLTWKAASFTQAGSKGWKESPCAAGSVNSPRSVTMTPSSSVLREATLMSGWKTHFCALPPLKKQIQYFLAALMSPFYFWG